MSFFSAKWSLLCKIIVLQNCRSPEDYEFGSPLMDIRLSPMLCLSNDALALLCGYLGNGE